MSDDSCRDSKLLVELVNTNLCKIISSGIEEKVIKVCLGSVSTDRLTRTDLLIKLLESSCLSLKAILLESLIDGLFLTELLDDILVALKA